MSKKMMLIVCAGSAGLFGYLVFLWALDSFQTPYIAIGIAVVFAGVTGFMMTKYMSEASSDKNNDARESEKSK